MRPLPLLLLPLLLAACQQPSREAVELAAELRRTPPDAQADALADQPIDCDLRDRACATLWLYRGAACARLAEAATTPEAARPGRRDCAVAAFARAAELTPADAPEAERMEAALRLADALERRRDRAMGEARQTDNAAILAAIAPLQGRRGGPAAHYAAGVTLNRLLAGDLPPAQRCAALREANAQAAMTAELPGLPPLGDRLAQRRAAIEAALATQTPRCI